MYGHLLVAKGFLFSARTPRGLAKKPRGRQSVLLVAKGLLHCRAALLTPGDVVYYRILRKHRRTPEMGRKYVSEAERKRNKENVCWNGFTSVEMKPKPPLC